jgi:2-oxoglutarate ferredoxin oxidoreductase subunit gamma
VVWNRTLFETPPVRPDCRWVPVDAGRLAAELDYLQGQSLVALGAFAALTGIVGLDTLGRALAELLPSYRRDSIPRNVACLERGAAAVADTGAARAWSA